METNVIHIGGRQHVDPEKINYLKADVNYTSVFFDDGHKVMVATTIGHIHDRLNNYPHFFRINKGTLVNLDKVSEVSEYCVVLHNGETVIVARRRQKEFRKLIAN